MLESAGTLLYRSRDGVWEVLLVHPSGNYNRSSAWSIPKGLPDADESLEETARRETLEETGVKAEALLPIGSVEYRSRKKQVHCFLGQADASSDPHCASWEVDHAEFVSLESAYRILHQDQIPFLDRLVEHLRKVADEE